MADLYSTITRGTQLAGAVFSACERYRYRLWRAWDPSKPRLLWVMLNPSTADESVLDPTLRRCDDYAKRWGFGSFEVVNLFAWRATDPKELRSCPSPVGPLNNSFIAESAQACAEVIVGWGASTWSIVRERSESVCDILAPWELYCLRTSKSGAPVHPLYQPSSLTMKPWPARAEVARV